MIAFYDYGRGTLTLDDDHNLTVKHNASGLTITLPNVYMTLERDIPVPRPVIDLYEDVTRAQAVEGMGVTSIGRFNYTPTYFHDPKTDNQARMSFDNLYAWEDTDLARELGIEPESGDKFYGHMITTATTLEPDAPVVSFVHVDGNEESTYPEVDDISHDPYAFCVVLYNLLTGHDLDPMNAGECCDGSPCWSDFLDQSDYYGSLWQSGLLIDNGDEE